VYLEQQVVLRHVANHLADLRRGRVRKPFTQYFRYEKDLIRQQLEIRFPALGTNEEMAGTDAVETFGELWHAVSQPASKQGIRGTFCEPEIVQATVHSDDRVAEARFDAIPYLKRAPADNLVQLARCGWENDYPADEVALYTASNDRKVRTVFKHIDLYNARHKEHIGFECSVSGQQAIAWLRKHRSDVHVAIEQVLERLNSLI